VILLDTHVVIWLVLEQTHLSKKPRAAINDPRKNGDGSSNSEETQTSDIEFPTSH